MATYEIYIKHFNNQYEHIRTTINESLKTDIIDCLLKDGHTVTVLEKYDNGDFCKSEFKPRER